MQPRRFPSSALAVLALAVCAPGADSQTADRGLPELEVEIPRASLRLRADSLARIGRHEEALTLYDELLERSPAYDVALLAGLGGLVASFLAPDDDQEKAWLRRTIGYARQAMELQPGGVDGRYLNIAATGRLALLESSPRERARLGVVVDTAARGLLAQDPSHASAHNALGKLYFQLAELNWFERLFAKRWMGADLLDRATWEAAEAHLRRAVELQPGRIFHLVDLGALLAERGRREEARDVLGKALGVPLEDPVQEEFREEARRILEDLGEEVASGG